MAITKTANVQVTISRDEELLIGLLEDARLDAINLNNHCSPQGTYGTVVAALQSALSTSIYRGADVNDDVTEHEAGMIATALFNAAIDNGEPILAQIARWNASQITV